MIAVALRYNAEHTTINHTGGNGVLVSDAGREIKELRNRLEQIADHL